LGPPKPRRPLAFVQPCPMGVTPLRVVRSSDRRCARTDRDFVERSGHHGYEHVQQNDDSAPVVDAEDNVAETLGEAAVISAQFNGSRVFQSKHRPVDRTKRVLQTATANRNRIHWL